MATDNHRLIIGQFTAESISGCLEGKDGKGGINDTDGEGSTPVLLRTSPEAAGSTAQAEVHASTQGWTLRQHTAHRKHNRL